MTETESKIIYILYKMIQIMGSLNINKKSNDASDKLLDYIRNEFDESVWTR